MPGPGRSLKSLAKDERPTRTVAIAARLLGYLRPHGRDVARGVGWLLASSAATAASPALTGRLIDIALESRGNGDWRVLTPTALLLVGAALGGWFAQRMQILTLGTAGQQALAAVRADVFDRIISLDIGFFESVESGDLMSRLINDIEQVNSFLSQSFRRLLSSGFSLAATLIFMLAVEWRLALATLLVVPVMLGVTRLFGMLARAAFRRRQESIGDVSATLAEELGGIRVAQAFNRTARNRAVFMDRNAVNRDANISAAAVSSAFSPALSVISTGATALIAALGGWSAAQGAITIGVVVAFLNYARQFFNAITQLSSLYSETQSALAGGERVFALVDTPSAVTEPSDPVTPDRVDGRITFENVHFAYRTGDDVLHGVDLHIEAGETVAIVGETGAGKSTLINLLPRFHDPRAGTVRLDGIDVRRLSLHGLRRHLGIVLQDPFLFEGTISDNIGYGSADANETRIREAAELAGALPFIEGLPEGFETRVGERGASLSTGQRQLVAFARAVVGDPRVFLLDEPTSSVDTRTEQLIQRGLRTILADRTALIVAHRLSTVRDADRVVVMDDGRIIEEGPYERLLASDGPFAALHRAQFDE
jgi:ATP-binding cassette subfamily B protein/subfamily B ATP-binding cassette protein MsbA